MRHLWHHESPGKSLHAVAKGPEMRAAKDTSRCNGARRQQRRGMRWSGPGFIYEDAQELLFPNGTNQTAI